MSLPDPPAPETSPYAVLRNRDFLYYAVGRFVACLHDTSDLQSEGRVLVVAHATMIRLALCHLLGAPLGDYRRLFPTIGNCALTEIRMTGGRPALLGFNVPVDGAPMAPATDERPQPP